MLKTLSPVIISANDKELEVEIYMFGLHIFSLA